MATEYRTVYDLTPEELDELRAAYYEQCEQDGVTSGEGYEAITDEMLFEHYDGVSFVRDDFFCNMIEESEEVGMKKQDYETMIQNKNNSVPEIPALFNSIINMLPDCPDSPITFWTDGEKILVQDVDRHAMLMDFFGDMGIFCTSGYYDPEEDKRDNSVDDHTGNYYINLE